MFFYNFQALWIHIGSISQKFVNSCYFEVALYSHLQSVTSNSISINTGPVHSNLLGKDIDMLPI